MLIYAASHGALGHIRPLRRAGYLIVLPVDDPTRTASMWSASTIAAGRRSPPIIWSGSAIAASPSLDAGSLARQPREAEDTGRVSAKGGIAFDPRLLIDPEGPAPRMPMRQWRPWRGRESRHGALASNDLLAFGAPAPAATAAFRAGRPRWSASMTSRRATMRRCR